MRAVVQRIDRGEVRVDGRSVGRVGPGLLVYLGSADGDGERDIDYVARKIAHLRVFIDDDGKMNRSVLDTNGAVLVVPAFTTLADARQGRRPAFVKAAEPEAAQKAYEAVVAALRAMGLEVATGAFRESMEVESVNAGPICVLLDSTKLF